MTEMPDLNLGKCAAAAALTPHARQLHLRVLETLAISGLAPWRAELSGPPATGARNLARSWPNWLSGT